MATLLSLTVKLGDRIQDTDTVLAKDKRESAIQEALLDYARFRPRRLVSDVVGNGTDTYALPTGWALESSVLESIEFPLGESPPTYLEEEAWVLYRTASITVLRLLGETPSATQTLRLLFTGPHSVTVTTSTVPVADEEAVVNKAASICCLWLAAHYAQQGQATLSADVTNHRTKADVYRDLAKMFQAAYNNHLGIDSKDGSAPVAAASAVLDWDSGYPWGEDRLTHPRRWQ